MERVDGIGGFFFRCRNPAAMAAWYSEHLGIDRTPADYDHAPWQQQAGPTAFEPFPFDTAYFGAPEHLWMLNFRVHDLMAMVAQLRAAGIDVEVDDEAWPNGLFARLQDPEGNPVQLWEPREPAHAGPATSP